MGFLRWLCFCIIAATNWVCAAPIPPPTSLLVDQVGVLRDAERAALLARLQAIQASGRAQIAILISSGTEGAPLADYALQVAESWQLGRARRDDGLLILVVPSPAAVRLEVGYGLEGVIPDARASQWIDELLPAVKNEQLARGSAARGEVRWSLWFLGLALLLALPFGVLALFLSIGGEDFQMQLAQAAAGGGSIAGILALAARYGLFAAVQIGLGGRFGGGGAGRGE